MKNSWLILSVLFAVLFYSYSDARQGVLDSLIQKALQSNPDIRASESMITRYKFQSNAAGALPDPSVSLGLINLPKNSLSFGETPMSGINIGVTQKLPWPGKLSNRKKLAANNYQIAQSQTDYIKTAVIKSTTDSYITYSYWSLSIPPIQEFLELLEKTKSITEVRYENGENSIQDILNISTLQSRLKVRLLEAKQNRDIALVWLRNVTYDSSLSENLAPTLGEVNSVKNADVTFHGNPLLKQSELSVEKSKINKSLEKSSYYPDITLGIDYRIREQVPGDPVRGQDFLSFKVGFTLPLWFHKSQRNKNEAARTMIHTSQEQMHSLVNNLTARMNEEKSNINTLIQSISEYDNSILPESRALVDAAQIAYEVGQIDFVAYLNAQKNLFEIKLERLNLLKQYHLSRARFAEIIGTIDERE
jgi:outer membrane protein TolC